MRASERIAALGAVATLLVVAAFVIADLGSAYRTTADQISQNHGIPSRDRRIQGAFGLQISRDFLVEARGFVDRAETYALVSGSNLAGEQQPVITALPAFTSYALLPSRSVAPADADWLLCYGCDLTSFPRAIVVWQQGGLAIARLSR